MGEQGVARRRPARVAVAGVLALVVGGGLAACSATTSATGPAGSGPASTAASAARVVPSPAPSGSPAPSPTTTPSPDRAAARAVADGLLALVPVPPDAAVRPGGPDGLPVAREWQRDDESASAGWTVATDPRTTWRWLAAHLPRDVGRLGPVPGRVTTGPVVVVLDPRPDPDRGRRIGGLQMMLQMAPHGSGTLVRVDVHVVPLIAGLVPVTARPDVRMSAAGACPRWLPGTTVVNDGPQDADLATRLLPDDAATSAVVCHYPWSGRTAKTPPPLRVVLGATAARALADAVRALPVGVPYSPGPRSCPAMPVNPPSETGDLVLVSFADRSVSLAMTGFCGWAWTSNGHVSVGFGPTYAVLGLPQAVR